jgi:hypothetical protein
MVRALGGIVVVVPDPALDPVPRQLAHLYDCVVRVYASLSVFSEFFVQTRCGGFGLS